MELSQRIADLEAENERLKEALGKAVAVADHAIDYADAVPLVVQRDLSEARSALHPEPTEENDDD